MKMYTTDCGRNDIDLEDATFDLTYAPEFEPSWDEYKNDDFTLRKISLNRFVKVVNTVIVR
jgi:hypothetical protein